MRRIGFLACWALLATPAMAQDRACRDLRALLNADGSDFRSVAWTIDPRGGVHPTIGGRRVDLPAAQDCDMEVRAGRSAGFHCSWEATESTGAGAVYDRLTGRINACLATPLAAGSPYAGATVRIVQSHNGSFVTGQRQTDIGLTLYEHAAIPADSPGGPRSISYAVQLSVELDLENVVTPEEAGSGD